MLALSLGACGQDGEDAAAGDAPPIPVETVTTTLGEIAAVYSGTAALEAESEADVLTKVGGEVIELRVEEGDRVEAGQVLAVLDGERLRLELARSEAEVRRLAQEYERNVELHEQGIVSAGAFENLKYELDALQAAQDLAALELAYTNIRAPIAGIVTHRFIKLGNTLAVNQPTFHIADLDPLLAHLYVPEREYRLLEPGHPATLDVDALAGGRFAAHIDRIAPAVDPATGTFKVTIEVEDPDRQLKPGMFSRVSIVYDTHADALLIPRVALVDDDTSAAVFVIEDSVAHRREVRTGFVDAGSIEILNGLRDGDQVVVIGQNGLRDGTRVDVVNEPGPGGMHANSDGAR
ncbi:MAG: efflux RND transporter periplasmic adaptor subunit [Gammaproteobacteria bacterium]|nr:efflux RND transporter periplasmic adaptor subunit [Gammaproteobacteria bacterium]